MHQSPLKSDATLHDIARSKDALQLLVGIRVRRHRGYSLTFRCLSNRCSTRLPEQSVAGQS